jgi:hypothetical protein
VDVGAVIKSLHERGLIDVVGRAEGLGRPLLYGTTPMFLEQFGLRHLAELPRVDELAIALRKDGQPPVLAADELEAADAAAAESAAVGASEPVASAGASSPEGAATA